MTLTLQLFGILAGILLIVFVLRAIVKRIITERQSLFWIFLGGIVIIFCAFPGLCTLFADFFGVEYAPSIIFMAALVIVGFGLFYCFQRIAKLTGQIRDLAIHLTIAQNRIKELEGEEIDIKSIEREPSMTSENGDAGIHNDEKAVIYN